MTYVTSCQMVQKKNVYETESKCGKMIITVNLSKGYTDVHCTSLAAFLKVSWLLKTKRRKFPGSQAQVRSLVGERRSKSSQKPATTRYNKVTLSQEPCGLLQYLLLHYRVVPRYLYRPLDKSTRFNSCNGALWAVNKWEQTMAPETTWHPLYPAASFHWFNKRPQAKWTHTVLG